MASDMESDKHLLKHNETDTLIEINHDPFVIGRGLYCHYVIESPTISRKHCVLVKIAGHWFVKNLSQNGTFVNGALIKDNAKLHHADIITVEPNRFSFMFLKIKPISIPITPFIVEGRSSISDLESVPSVNGGPVNSEPAHREALSAENEETGKATNVPPVSAPTDLVTNELDSDVEFEQALLNLDSEYQQGKQLVHNTDGTTNLPQINNLNVNSLPSTSRISNSPVRKKSRNSKELKCDLDCNKDKIKLEVDECNKSNKPELTNIDKIDKAKTQDNIEEMEDEMLCSICSELFVKAMTLNCSHSFCKYCIETWKKTKNICPICRARITSLTATIVLDNLIEKIVQNSSEQIKLHRKELLEERKKCEEAAVMAANQSRGRGGRGGNRRGRGNQSNRGRGNAPNFQISVPPISQPVEISSESESSGLDPSDFSDSMSDDYDDENDWEAGIPGSYYGGYGHCYACGRRGHWASGCPFR